MASRAEELSAWSDQITTEERTQYELLFYSQGPVDGYLSGERARDLFLHARLPLTVLSQIWNVADVSNDNVLSVEEFVLGMHLILKVKDGLSVPRSLPKHLVPVVVASPVIEKISDREREAYQNVFNKVSQEQINAIQGRQLLLQSQLSVEELSHIWNLSDVNRDGQLDKQEWNVTCHLIRHLKKGGKLTGPVNVFSWIPECLSPVSYLARKHRVEEYNKKKHVLMTAKEKRKTQIDNEKRRLQLLRKRLELHKELYECSKSSQGLNIPEEEFKIYKEKEENNIGKVEAIIHRLTREHEGIRQETVKAILGEQGSTLQEDSRLCKLEQEEVRARLSTCHTKATKDPDPFHQLYELRRDLRKRSTLSEGEEPEVHFPFKSNPFERSSPRPCLSGHTIFISPDPSVLNNNNSHGQLSVKEDLYNFGEGFLERWSSERKQKDADYDPIFISSKAPMDSTGWSGISWGERDGVQANIQAIHQKLVDLKVEMQKLNDDSGGQLTFREGEDFFREIEEQKAQEEQRVEKLDRSKYQRRYHTDKKTDGEKDVTKRRSYYAPRPDDEAQRAREYRQKRRSLNLDKRSDISDKSSTSIPTATTGKTKRQAPERKSSDRPLVVSTDTSGSAFTPESASSPRTDNTEASQGLKSPRSATSPPRPSTKRKFAPPPPCSPTSKSSPVFASAPATFHTAEIPSTSSQQAVTKLIPVAEKSGDDKKTVNKIPIDETFTDAAVPSGIVDQSQSQQSKIPKPVVQSEPEELNPNQVAPVKLDESSLVLDKKSSAAPQEISQPNRPPRRRKRSEENKSFLHDSFQKEQNRKSKEIAVNVDIKSSKDSSVNTETIKTETVELPEPDSFMSKDEDSLLDAVIKELPDFKSENTVEESTKKPVEESAIKVNIVRKEESMPANKTVITVNGDDTGVESEIKPVKVKKPRGKFIDSEISSKIEFHEKDLSKGEVKDIDSDNEKIVIVANADIDTTVPNEVDEPDGYLDHIKPVCFKKAEDLEYIFNKISTFEEKDKVKDTTDTISIASNISSTGSEAPPLPDSAPPPLLVATVAPVEVKEDFELINQSKIESAPPSNNMADIMPEITQKASPREVSSPIDDLKASMFSMRGTSPTRELNEIKAYGILGINVERGNFSASDQSDDEGNQTKTFTPGDNVTQNVPLQTHDDDGGIQLISYNAKLNSPNSDQSGPDSAFEDMQSSMTSNDPLSNTLDEFVPEDFVSAERVDKTESAPPLPKTDVPKQFVLEFEGDSKPRGGNVTSPSGNKDFMAKAHMFAETVQRPPKMTVKRKKEITTPDDLTDERYIQLEAERRAVISSSTMKKRDMTVTANNPDEAPVEEVTSPDPDDTIQEWRSEVNKRSNIPWEEKPDKVNLYSDNVIQETENSESVDRESIANLSSIRQQWESKFQSKQETQKSVPKTKQTPQQVRHWEVKLPTQLKKVPADIIRTTKSDSDSEAEEIMADTDHSNESAIEREIRLAMEREELLKKEQEERANLTERQLSSGKKEPFQNGNGEQNNNKPTYHEMTEADRGSELQQREEMIQQELIEQKEREAAIRADNNASEDSSHSSGEDDENANESIIEREIRIQRERESELEIRQQQLANTQLQSTNGNADTMVEDNEIVEEETVTVEYFEPVRTSIPEPVSSPENPSTPDNLSSADNLSETDEQTAQSVMRTRISYEEAISSAAHEGESLIARELREAREREDELQKQRERLAAGGGASASAAPAKKQAPAQNAPEPVVVTKTVEPTKPTYQQDVGPYKHARKQSTDSLSSGHSNDKTLNATPKNIRITPMSPFGSGGKIGGLNYKTPDKPKETKRQETPIEREIRLARERENELRVSKGLEPLQDVKKVEYESYGDNDDGIIVKSSSLNPSTNNRNNVQKFASSRLQKEINKQNEIEKKYRDEGKIKSTSEEHVGLVKYTEIAQKDYSTPKRNFSIQRKNEPTVPEQNGTPQSKVKSSPKVTSSQEAGTKFNRSTSSSGVTFSYKESRHKAESKIEQELREMREREEELRSQRVGAGLASPRSPRSPDNTSVLNKRSQFEQTS